MLYTVARGVKAFGLVTAERCVVSVPTQRGRSDECTSLNKRNGAHGAGYAHPCGLCIPA